MNTAQARRERFARARLYGDVSQAVQLELDAYNAAMNLALDFDWHKNAYTTAKEVVRHAARLALAQHVNPEIWATCRSCTAGAGACSACGGRRSLLISEGELAERIGIPFESFVAIWRPRIELIAREIGKWCEAGQGTE